MEIAVAYEQNCTKYYSTPSRSVPASFFSPRIALKQVSLQLCCLPYLMPPNSNFLAVDKIPGEVWTPPERLTGRLRVRVPLFNVCVHSISLHKNPTFSVCVHSSGPSQPQKFRTLLSCFTGDCIIPPWCRRRGCNIPHPRGKRVSNNPPMKHFLVCRSCKLGIGPRLVRNMHGPTQRM